MNMLLNFDYPQINWPGLLNGLVSIGIIFVCICRSEKITHHVLIRVKVAYLGLVMGAAVNALTPWLKETPGWGSVVFASSILSMLVLDSFQWRKGVPDAATDWPPLGVR